MKKLIIFGEFAILLVLLMASVSALGISPAKKTLDYAPGQDLNYSFRIFNDEFKDLNLEIEIVGDLSNFISLEYDALNIAENEESMEVNYILNVPEYAEFGLYESFISVSETSSSGGMVGASVAVNSKISLEIPEANAGLDFSFIVLLVLILAIIIVFTKLNVVKKRGIR